LTLSVVGRSVHGQARSRPTESEQGLQRLLRSSTAPAGLVQPARIVLLASTGVTNTAIAAQVGVSRPTVISWRARYEAGRIGGLRDEERLRRPRQIDRCK
jgi:hypothetical protein